MFKWFAIFFLLICVCVKSQWYDKSINLTDDIIDVDFISETTGYILTQNEIYKTTDNGNNWLKVTPADSVMYNKIFYLSGDTIIVGCEDSDFFPSTNRLFCSTNAGAAWSSKKIETNENYIWDISFSDINNGWLVGSDQWFAASRKFILHSSDGGDNWEYQFIDTMYAVRTLHSIAFFSNKLGMTIGSAHLDNFDETEILRTTNAGKDWERVDTLDSPLFFINYLDSGRVQLLGGRLYESADYGVTWNDINFSFWQNKFTWDISNDGGNYAILISQLSIGRQVYYFNSGQDSAIVMKPAKANSIKAVECIGNSIWAVGKSGLILKYEAEITDLKDDDSNKIIVFKLLQNFPNPFNPSTTIKFRIPDNGAVSGIVSLKVYDITGELVADLVNGQKSAGEYSVIFNPKYLSSGVYFYRLQAGKFSETRRMLYMR